MSVNEEKLFNEVFLQFHPLLFAFGKRIITDDFVVEEAIQEMFLYIYEKEIKLATIHSLKAYLFTSFRRRLLSKKSLLNYEDLSTNIEFSSQDFVQEKENQNRQNQKLTAMLNNLPWRQREAIYLKYFNRLTIKEISEIMEIKPQVVSNTIYKALKKMKKIATT